MIKSQFKTGKGSGYGAFDKFCELACDFIRVFVHIVFNPIKHQTKVVASNKKNQFRQFFFVG